MLDLYRANKDNPMCGIFALGCYKTKNSMQQAFNTMVESLALLCYRGNDSSGICIFKNGLERFYERAEGVSENLKNRFRINNDDVTTQPLIGLGHTRWATHGKVCETNSHPIRSGDFYVVHNGIINNFKKLKKELESKGTIFKTATDTEIAAAYADNLYKNNPNLTLYEIAYKVLEACDSNNSAFVFASRKHPNELAAISRVSPLKIAKNTESDEYFISSDISAVVLNTLTYHDLENHSVAHISQNGLKIYNEQDGKLVENKDIPWITYKGSTDEVKLGNFKHFMEKEIKEQGKIINNMINKRIDFETQTVKLSGLGTGDMNAIIECKRILIIGMGTSYHAAMAVQPAIHFFTKKECRAISCSMFYDEHIQVSNQDVIILVSQSGETADMLNVQRKCKECGAFLIAITNRELNPIYKQSNCGIRIGAGIEIAVASTKAFSCQYVTLLLIALRIAQEQKTYEKERKELIEAIKELPNAINTTLHVDLRRAIQLIKETKSLMIVGGWGDRATSKEGALKICEVDTIMTDDVHCSDLKHGKLSLVDSKLSIIMIISDIQNGQNKNKLISYNSYSQIETRGGKPVIICNEKNKNEYEKEYCIVVPFTHVYLQPILNVIPMQLISYLAAKKNGYNPDMPRNLAKSVTVS